MLDQPGGEIARTYLALRQGLLEARDMHGGSNQALIEYNERLLLLNEWRNIMIRRYGDA